MVNTVLLTRNGEQNLSFKKLLAPCNAKFISLPLLEYLALPLGQDARQIMMDLDRYDQIIFISQNAVDFGLAQLQSFWPQWPQSLQWFAVGPMTGARLRAQDIPVILPVKASSEGLLELDELQELHNRKLIIVRGNGGRELLKNVIVERGGELEYLEVYQRKRIHYPKEAITLPGENIITPVYSGEALAHLADLIEREHHRYTLLLPSKRLQAMAIEFGFDKVELVDSQRADAMVEAVKKLINKRS